jgi:DNA-directed RNA polymerase subunit RPC12/RpoP
MKYKCSKCGDIREPLEGEKLKKRKIRDTNEDTGYRIALVPLCCNRKMIEVGEDA